MTKVSSLAARLLGASALALALAFAWMRGWSHPGLRPAARLWAGL